jgi:hypothetical protein
MVTTQTSFIDFVATAGVTTFNFPFFALEAAHVKALLWSGSEWSPLNAVAKLNANRVGGTVSMLSSVTAGGLVRIVRETPNVQELHLAYNSELPAEALEMELDRRTCVEQEVQNLAREIFAQNKELLALKQGPKGDTGAPGAPGGQGAPWLSTVFYCVTNGSGQPPVPTADIPIPPGWSDGITDPNVGIWWSSTAWFNADNVRTSAWTVPMRETAEKRDVSFIFKLAPPDAPPAKPTTPSPATPNGWLDGPVSATTTFACWCCKGPVVDGVVLIWSDPVIWGGKNGKDGVDGWSSHELYKAADEQPATPSPVPSPNGWFATPQAAWSANPGATTLWWITTYINEAGTEVDPWSVPVDVAGEKGEPGNYSVTAYYYGPPTPVPATPNVTDKVPFPRPTNTSDATGNGRVGWYDLPDATYPVDAGKVWWWSEGMADGKNGQVGVATWSPPQRSTGTGAGQVVSRFAPAQTNGLPPALPPAAAWPEAGSPWVFPSTELSIWETRNITDETGQPKQVWTAAVRIKGEDGKYLSRIYFVGTAAKPLRPDQMATHPSGGWGAWPDQVGVGAIVWMSEAWFSSDGTLLLTGGYTGWGDAVRVTGESGKDGASIRGENGVDGISVDVAFQVSLIAPVLPAGTELGGWSTSQPALIPEGYKLWMTSRTRREAVVVTPWSGPTNITGVKGERGPAGDGISTTAKGEFIIPFLDAAVPNDYTDGTLRICRWNVTGGVVNLQIYVASKNKGVAGKGPTNALDAIIFPLSDLPKYLWPKLPLRHRSGSEPSSGLIPGQFFHGTYGKNDSDNPLFGVIELSEDGLQLLLSFYIIDDYKRRAWSEIPAATFAYSANTSWNLDINPGTDMSPVIVSVSPDATVDPTKDTELFVLVSGQNNTYNWVVENENGSGWLNLPTDDIPATGSATDFLTIPAANFPTGGNTWRFRCVITNPVGTTTSRIITLAGT